MKKIAIILLLITLILSSCNPKIKNDNATIQIWWYNYNNSGFYTDAIEAIILKLEIYCKDNNIPIEVVKHEENTLAYEDYILKRNAAMANGNMIIIDDAGRLHDIARLHADYSKIENYANLMDAYKDRFCIPIGVGYQTIAINNEALKHYDIDVKKNVISYYDYLKIIQQMKEKGAKFKLTQDVINNTVQYYMMKNDIRYLNENSEILKNKEEFKAAIKKTLIDVYEDFKTYYNDIKYDEKFLQISDDQSHLVYDEVSTLTILDKDSYNDGSNIYFLSDNPIKYLKLKDSIIDKTFVMYSTFNSPCAYMNKNVTNNKIYDIFNEMLKEPYFKAINPTEKIYSPVIDSEKIRKYLEVDENWEYNGHLKAVIKNDKKENVVMLNTINDAYNMMAKDKEKLKYIADTYFSNNDFYAVTIFQIRNLINKELVNSGFDYNKKEIDDMINKQLDDFILNFYIHYK